MKCVRVLAISVILVVFALLVTTVVIGESAADSEANLRKQLEDVSGATGFHTFAYGDYDGDGIHEAFALTDQGMSDDMKRGEVWFVSPNTCTALCSTDTYSSAGAVGKGVMLFYANRCAGAASTAYIWAVENSTELVQQDSAFDGISTGERENEFIVYPGEFDGNSDGTGHTWKPYYLFLDGTELVEYGGIKISRSELEEVAGAAELLAEEESYGYTVGEIYYHGNDIITVNLTAGSDNSNLILRYNGKSVELENTDSGVYQASSGRVRAVFPERFEHAVTAGSQTDTDATETAAPTATPVQTGFVAQPVNEANFPESGTPETITAAIGCLDTELQYGIKSTEANGEKHRLYFDEYVFEGGSIGYNEEWFTSGGVAADAKADLDGDGADEYLVIYASTQKAAGANDWDRSESWYVGIYEPDGAEYRFATSFRVGLSAYPDTDGRLTVELVPNGSAKRIMTTSLGYGDGATGGITAALYSYNGTGAVLDAYFNAYIPSGGCAAEGSMDPNALFTAVDSKAEAEAAFGGKVTYLDGAEYGYTNPWNYSGDYSQCTGFNPDARVHFDQIAALARNYGIGMELNVSSNGYSLGVSGGEKTLFSIQCAPESAWQAFYVDLTGNRIVRNGAASSQAVEEITFDAVVDTPEQTNDVIDTPEEGNTTFGVTIEGESGKSSGNSGKQSGNSGKSGEKGRVYITGSVNVRERPDKNSRKVTAINPGKYVEYLGERSTDSRGVEWYKVRSPKGNVGWVSSKYARLELY